MEDINDKINQYFEGKVVQKDLTKEIKGNAVVPTYVLEYLLGQHCASSDPDIVAAGVEKVKSILANHYVHRDEAESVKHKIVSNESHTIIDKVAVRFNDRRGVYEAAFSNLNIKGVLVNSETVKKHKKLLTSGVWCIVKMGYHYTEDKTQSPWLMLNLKPVQISSIDLEEYKELRKHFSSTEWMKLLLQSLGLNPEMFNFRSALIQLARLIPFCENNYNLIELGPKGTGKSHVFSELSPHGILISGGEVTQAKLFVNNANSQIGLVGYWDVVAFDEFAGSGKTADKKLVDIMKNYMANKNFSRGTDVYNASASFAFVGNTEHSVSYMLRHSNLFEALPKAYYDSAFLDRIHAYLPGWEVGKLRNEMFASGYGFIVDYLAEILKELKKDDYSLYFNDRLNLDESISTRDKTSIFKTISGFLKILFPHGEFSQEELRTIADFSIEMRKRVKNQLILMDETFEPVHFAYTEPQNGSEYSVETLEERSQPKQTEDAGFSEEIPDHTGAEPVEKVLRIEDNQTGVTYKGLFGPYLKGATEIHLQDPYIRAPHQFYRLMEFCLMLDEINDTGHSIHLHLITNYDEGKREQSLNQLSELQSSLQELDINLTWEFKPKIHARYIDTDHGWHISMDRGLDFYEKPVNNFHIAALSQKNRQCRAVEINFTRLDKQKNKKHHINKTSD